PLADWRTVVWPSIPYETFVPVAGDPTEPDVVREAIAPEIGLFRALRLGPLLVLPTLTRGALRAVQCPLTDPVSFALLDGRETAAFPAAPGWSAHDWARRAVDEHRAWLESERDNAPLTIREWPEPAARRATPAVR